MEDFRESGYLNHEYKMFLLKDSEQKIFEAHFHSFYKLLIFLNGDVNYYIEGKNYMLLPNDIILVKPGDIHKPIVNSSEPYERIIIYLSDNFFAKYKTDKFDLSLCFKFTHKNNTNLLRSKNALHYISIIPTLKKSFSDKDYASELYQKSILIQLLIQINRAVLSNDEFMPETSTQNKIITSTLKYINTHIEEKISIDKISQALFLNRSYIMHLFKSETGMTIFEYIKEKRLFHAKTLMSSELSLTEIAYKCGYNTYSSFYRDFSAKFGISPYRMKKSYLSDL